MEIELSKTKFTLLYEKALWRAVDSTLIIADIHLGKASHFRKAGIQIPALSQQEDYKNLRDLFNKVKPLHVLFLGDLFHSSFNRDWHYFEDLINEFQGIKFTLIKGNHDIMNKELFSSLHIEVVSEFIEDEFFIYSHKPVTFDHEKINISGHLHPGVLLTGKGRSVYRVPCFYHTKNQFLLPAFGRLTGLQILPVTKSVKAYLVLPDSVCLHR